MSLKYTVNDMQKLAENRGFTFLSEAYEGMLKKHKWMCEIGHTWEARPNGIKNGGGCPKCSHAQLRRNIKDLQHIAKSSKLELVSTQFLGMKKKYLWKCKDGHIWSAIPNNIKNGTGCPKCYGPITEERARYIFESLLGKPFPRDRVILGGKLELDGYCRELKIAFEYNGEQHHNKNHYFNKKALPQYSSVANNDIKKVERCKALGIIKIDVPYTEKENLEHFIREQIKRHLDYNLQKSVDWTKFNGKTSKYRILANHATSKGGELLTQIYLGSHSRHTFKCNKCNTEWLATAKDVLQKNSWCPQCAPNKKHTIEEVKEIANKHGFMFASSEYDGMCKKHLFICNKCEYHWLARPNNIQQGDTCPNCNVAGRRAARNVSNN